MLYGAHTDVLKSTYSVCINTKGTMNYKIHSPFKIICHKYFMNSISNSIIAMMIYAMVQRFLVFLDDSLLI